MLLRFLLVVFVLSTTVGFAQRKKKSAKEGTELTSVGPYFPDANKYAPKSKKKRGKGGISRYSMEDSKEQRGKVKKQKKKAERILEGRNYSSTNYFGHRRPPRKSKPGKAKYCKICGIEH